MAYEYTDAVTGVRYLVEGRRVYRITDQGNLVYDHDVMPALSGWQRFMAALRRVFGG